MAAETPPTLSIVIVPYNVRALLQRCLASVFASKASFEFEVTVVDTGSDGSAAMVRAAYPDVTVIEAPENPGYAAANNLGLRHAHGRYCLLLNPDTAVPEDAFARAVAAMEADPSIGILGAKLVRADGSLDLACRRSFPTPSNALFHFLRLPRFFPDSARFGEYNLTYRDPNAEYDVDAVAGAFMLLRRVVLDQVGLLDESYWMYGEDLDICWRARDAGWRTRYLPTVHVLHFKGESSKGRPLRCTYWFYRAMHLFYARHYAPRSPGALNALVTVGIVAVGLTSLLSDQMRPAGLRRARPVAVADVDVP
jgi:GT2 family glycosyltransferase